MRTKKTIIITLLTMILIVTTSCSQNTSSASENSSSVNETATDNSTKNIADTEAENKITTDDSNTTNSTTDASSDVNSKADSTANDANFEADSNTSDANSEADSNTSDANSEADSNTTISESDDKSDSAEIIYSDRITCDAHRYEPFYGIWVFAGKDPDEAYEISLDCSVEGCDFYAESVLSSDWSNLNSEPYYLVTAGRYDTKEEAESNLKSIKAKYSSAYIKYSGENKTTPNGDSRYSITCMGGEYIDGENVIIAAVNDDDEECIYIIDENTSFDSSCNMDFFDDYDNESVLDWYKKVLSRPDSYYSDQGLVPPIHGVFDVSITDNHIDKYYGCYWWD